MNSQNDSGQVGDQMALFSQVDSLVKASQSPDSDLEQTTTAISGRNISASLTKLTPIGFVAKTLLESLAWKINPAYTGMYSLKWKIVKLPAFTRLTIMKRYTHDRQRCLSWVSVKTLKKEDMKCKRLLYRLAVLKRPIKGNGYGLLHTVQTQGLKECDENGKTQFINIELLATPKSTRSGTITAERGAELGWTWTGKSWLRPDGSKVQSELAQQVQMGLLSTPSAMMPGDTDMEKLDQRRATAKLSKKNGDGFGPSLNELAVKNLLPTPTVNSDKSANHKDGKQRKGHGDNLRGALKGFMATPASQDGKNSTLPISQRNRDSVVGYAMEELEEEDLQTSQLNPQFVAEMMGFPTNWTVLPFQNGETKV